MLALSIALVSLITVISFATTIFAKHLGVKKIAACGIVTGLVFLPAMMEFSGHGRADRNPENGVVIEIGASLDTGEELSWLRRADRGLWRG